LSIRTQGGISETIEKISQTISDIPTSPTGTQILRVNKKRVGFTIYSNPSNTDLIYLYRTNKVSATGLERIVPGGLWEDKGERQTVYDGPVWLVGATANLTVDVVEIVLQ